MLQGQHVHTHTFGILFLFFFLDLSNMSLINRVRLPHLSRNPHRLFWWPPVSSSNKQVHGICGPAFSGLPLHQPHCPSSHANVVQKKKRYLALKTWHAVKKGVWRHKCDRRLQEENPRLAAWRWVRGGQATCFLPSRGIFCGQAWLLEMKDSLRGCGIVKSLNPFTKALPPPPPPSIIFLHSISAHL